jgi:hypothetical protein
MPQPTTVPGARGSTGPRCFGNDLPLSRKKRRLNLAPATSRLTPDEASCKRDCHYCILFFYTGILKMKAFASSNPRILDSSQCRKLLASYLLIDRDTATLRRLMTQDIDRFLEMGATAYANLLAAALILFDHRARRDNQHISS